MLAKSEVARHRPQSVRIISDYQLAARLIKPLNTMEWCRTQFDKIGFAANSLVILGCSHLGVCFST
jgi:hypothetical protein